MKINTFVLTALTVACIPVAITAATQTVHADAKSNEPLQVQMELVSAKKFAPGEPIVVHYTIVNESASDEATLLVGANDDEWYSINTTDAAGHLVQALPKPLPQSRRQEGLYQPSERTLLPGQKIEGNIVASSSLPVALPGQYNLHVEVLLNYVVRPISGETIAESGADLHKISEDFAFITTVTSNNLPLVRVKAEELRRQLVSNAKKANLKTIAEELFSMPETAALPTWESLILTPATSDFVLADAAEQLSRRPSRASADLVAHILWEPSAGPETRSAAQTDRVWTAMSKIYDTAPPSLKPYIRSLYIEHGVLASELDHPHMKSHPN